MDYTDDQKGGTEVKGGTQPGGSPGDEVQPDGAGAERSEGSEKPENVRDVQMSGPNADWDGDPELPEGPVGEVRSLVENGGVKQAIYSWH